MLKSRPNVTTAMAVRVYSISTIIKFFSPVVRTQTAEGFGQGQVRILKGTEFSRLRKVFLFICITKGQLA